MAVIGNGYKFPKAVKLAALKASKLKGKNSRSVAKVAADFNMSKSTLGAWRRQAKIQEPVPAGIAAHIKAAAAIKEYNTPTIVDYTTKSGSTAQAIRLKGVLYK